MELNIYPYLCDLINYIENEVETCGAWSVGTDTVKKELTYLLPLVDRSLSWICVDEDNNLDILLNRFKILITKARHNLHLLCHIERSQDIWFSAICDILQEIWLLKPDMVLVLRLLPKLLPAFSTTPFLDEVLDGYIESLVENLVFLLNYKADFVAPFREEVEVVKGNLEFLKGFVSLILKKCNRQSDDFRNFWNHVTAVAKRAAVCTCSLVCLAYKSDDCISFMPVDLLQSSKPAKRISVVFMLEAYKFYTQG